MNVNLQKINGVLAGVSTTKPNGFIHYVGNVTSRMKINGFEEANSRAIDFQVSNPGTKTARLYEYDARNCVKCPVSLPPGVTSVVEAEAAKDNSLVGSFGHFDHCSTVWLLARAVAHYRFEHSLDPTLLKGSEDLRYQALRAQVHPIASSGFATFMPQGKSTGFRPEAISAIVHAVSGCGGTVYSTVVGVDGEDRAKVPSVADYTLAMGCVEALNVLHSMYAACDAGELFMFALVCGLHSGGTVVGGTDEGGVMRDVFRAVKFARPYGPIVRIEANNFLPAVTIDGGFEKLVDGLLLQSAGAVALCDPMVDVGGKLYPTQLVSAYEYSDEERAKEDARLSDDQEDPNKGVDGDALSHIGKLQECINDFGVLYARALGLIGGTAGGASHVVRVLQTCLCSLQKSALRHLKFKVVSPFFFIEPTCSTRFDASSFPMQQQGYGRLGSVDKDGSMPALRDYECVGQSAVCTGYKISFRGARRHGVLHHLTANPKDGLSHIKVRQVSAQKVCGLGAGHDGRRGESLRDKMVNRRGLDEYLWRRGTSSVICPGEFTVVNGSLAVVIQERTVDVDTLECTMLHAPTSKDLAGDVTFEVHALNFLCEKRTSGETTVSRRQRATAAKALDRARREGQSPYVDFDVLLPITSDDADVDDVLPEESNTDTVDVLQLGSAQRPGNAKGARLPIVKTHGTTPAPRPEGKQRINDPAPTSSDEQPPTETAGSEGS